MHPSPWSNWAGNQRSTATRVVQPGSIDEVADAVRAARADGLTVKPVGSGHSFTATALTDGVRLDLGALTTPYGWTGSAAGSPYRPG
jgi:L-gulonolactone oxidase